MLFHVLVAPIGQRKMNMKWLKGKKNKYFNKNDNKHKERLNDKLSISILFQQLFDLENLVYRSFKKIILIYYLFFS